MCCVGSCYKNSLGKDNTHVLCQDGMTATDVRNFLSKVVQPFIKACVDAKAAARNSLEALVESLGEENVEVASLQVVQTLAGHEDAFRVLSVAESGAAGWNPTDFSKPWSEMKTLLGKAKIAEALVLQQLGSLRQARRIQNNVAGSEARQDANAVRRVTVAMHKTGFPQELYAWLLKAVQP